VTNRPKRFLVVGEGIWHWYMGAASDALRQLGYEVHEFHWADTFKTKNEREVEPVNRSTWHRVEERVGFGPIVYRLNSELLRTAAAVDPDYIFFYNVRLIHPRTVRALKRQLPQAVFGQYANDNPFSERASVGYWHNFTRSVPLFDLHFAYRLDNLDDYRRHGARNVHLLRAYYLPEVDRPIPAEDLSESDHSDVLFAGHFEPDGRLQALTEIVEAGVHLRLHGGGWAPILESLPAGHRLRSQLPAKPVVGDDYRKAIAGAKVALCFLSTMNKDTYTRRNFEIPAIGTAVLSQYSEDLAQLFRESEEIAFFRSPQDVSTEALALLSDDERRTRVAQGGHERVLADGHDVVSRMALVAQAFEVTREERWHFRRA
jgi:hypothetical protein